MDEFGPLNLLPRAGRCLAGGGKGARRHRATYSRKGGVRHVLAAYDLEGGKLFGRSYPRKTWERPLGFLRWLRRRYRKGEVLHVVLDNHGPHVKAEVVAWARRHEVRFYLTATNASWVNRVECPCTGLKGFALSNSDYRTHEEIQAAIESLMQWRNGKRPISKQSGREFKRAKRPVG